MRFFFLSLLLFAHLQGKPQKELLEKNGYLVLKNFFSKAQVQLLKTWAEEMDRESKLLLELSKSSGYSIQELAKTLPQALIVVPESNDPMTACRVEDMLTCYPDLHAFISGTLETYLGALMQEPYVCFKDKLNFKWPGGGAFSPHQDFPAYSLFGPRMHITAMVAIDPATIENGCLQVADDWCHTFSHDIEVDQEALKMGKAVLPYVEGGKTHGSIQPQLASKIRWLPMEIEPGDCVLITSFVPHYSEQNRSSVSRRAMFFTFNRLIEGDYRSAYYYVKRNDYDNPVFHFGTPTNARTK